MKNNIKEKLKNKFKSIEKLKNIKVSSSILAIIILVLLLVCAYVLFFEINDYRKVREEKYDFYYYFISQKIEFEGKLSVNGQDRILSVTSEKVDIDSTPIYYKDYSGQVILPGNMEIVNPYKKFPMYKLGKYSKIYYKDNSLYVNSEAGEGKIYDSFLYDGENLYMFLEKTTVKIDDKEYLLSPLSFIDVSNNYIRIYNAESDNYEFIESQSKEVSAYTAEYMVDLLNDTFNYNTRYYMLIKSVDALELYDF